MLIMQVREEHFHLLAGYNYARQVSEDTTQV